MPLLQFILFIFQEQDCGINKTHLYDLGGAFRCTVPQVVAIDSQHLVIVSQFSILGCQTTREKVQDKDAALFRFTDELDAKRFGALTLH